MGSELLNMEGQLQYHGEHEGSLAEECRSVRIRCLICFSSQRTKGKKELRGSQLDRCFSSIETQPECTLSCYEHKHAVKVESSTECAKSSCAVSLGVFWHPIEKVVSCGPVLSHVLLFTRTFTKRHCRLCREAASKL